MKKIIKIKGFQTPNKNFNLHDYYSLGIGVIPAGPFSVLPEDGLFIDVKYTSEIPGCNEDLPEPSPQRNSLFLRLNEEQAKQLRDTINCYVTAEGKV